MEFILKLLPFVYLIVGLILLYQLFGLFSRVKVIKSHLLTPNYHKKYWIEKQVGNNDKAYEYLMKDYYSKLYDHKFNGDYPIKYDYKERLKKELEDLGKDIPNFEELEK